MTITRETLELAALAAGHAEARYESWPGMAIRHGYTCAIWTGDCYINPAESIADAARLAVALRMMVDITSGCVEVFGGERWSNQRIWHDGTEADMERAYCHAITLCAAEIGRRMKEAK